MFQYLIFLISIKQIFNYTFTFHLFLRDTYESQDDYYISINGVIFFRQYTETISTFVYPQNAMINTEIYCYISDNAISGCIELENHCILNITNNSLIKLNKDSEPSYNTDNNGNRYYKYIIYYSNKLEINFTLYNVPKLCNNNVPLKGHPLYAIKYQVTTMSHFNSSTTKFQVRF